MLCPAFYIGQLLAPGTFLFILSSFANSASQEPVFVSLLAGGHDISVVLELAVIQDDSVGCAGLGTAVTAGALHCSPGSSPWLCAALFPLHPPARVVWGVIFMR